MPGALRHTESGLTKPSKTMMPNTRMSLTLSAVLALAVTSLPLQAQEQAAEATEQAAVAADPAPAKKQKTRYERRICKSDAPTGTRIARSRTCLTQAQWEEAQRRSQDATNTVQTNQLMINRKIEGGQ
jgi:hypothetical protein